MARLRDLKPVFSRIGFFGYWKRVWTQCQEDNVFTWASALAYSWLFAIFPFFVFLLSLVPYMPIDAKVWLEENLETVLMKALPTDAYRTVWGFLTDKNRLDTLLHSHPKGFLSFGLVLTIWAASGGMAMTINAMDKCYDLEKARPFYRVRLMALLLTFIVASLLLVVLIALPIATALRTYVQNYFIHLDPPVMIPAWAMFIFEIARYLIALTCMFLALSVLYYFGPCVRQRFRIITPGAVFSVIVWLLLGTVFRLYVNTFGKYEQTYGPVGGVVILLLFFYLDAVVLLIGAEINSEIDFVAYGVKAGCRDFRGQPWEHEKVSATLEGQAASTG